MLLSLHYIIITILPLSPITFTVVIVEVLVEVIAEYTIVVIELVEEM